MGIFLLKGEFVEKNEEKAISYFEKCAKHYDVQGYFWFGLCLIEGRGIRKSFYRGLDLIQQANERNYFLAQLYYSLVQPFRRRYF